MGLWPQEPPYGLLPITTSEEALGGEGELNPRHNAISAWKGADPIPFLLVLSQGNKGCCYINCKFSFYKRFEL